MAIYFQFKSSIIKDSIPINGHYISVKDLKEKIKKFKKFRKGDSIVVVTNSQTKEDYLDDGALIPKCTSVLIRRGPGNPSNPIIAVSRPPPELPQVVNSGLVDDAMKKYPEDAEWDAFVNDLNANPESLPSRTSNGSSINNLVRVDHEDSKIKAGFGYGMRGSSIPPPPQGYVCHRCNVRGHFIQHCPTNGDPNHDFKRVAAAAVALNPYEAAAFDREMEDLPSMRSVRHFPPELHCPLCKKVMEYAMFASKCCFRSFCDKCIKEHTIAKSMCACGATNVLADDLLPNKTLRDAINHILESNTTNTTTTTTNPLSNADYEHKATSGSTRKRPTATDDHDQRNFKDESLKPIAAAAAVEYDDQKEHRHSKRQRDKEWGSGHPCIHSLAHTAKCSSHLKPPLVMTC